MSRSAVGMIRQRSDFTSPFSESRRRWRWLATTVASRRLLRHAPTPLCAAAGVRSPRPSLRGQPAARKAGRCRRRNGRQTLSRPRSTRQAPRCPATGRAPPARSSQSSPSGPGSDTQSDQRQCSPGGAWGSIQRIRRRLLAQRSVKLRLADVPHPEPLEKGVPGQRVQGAGFRVQEFEIRRRRTSDSDL